MSFVVGDGVAVIRREGSSAALVASILGRESADGRDTIWLDRLVHDETQEWPDCEVSGVISTVLNVPAVRP
jgi:hypothetical protein